MCFPALLSLRGARGNIPISPTSAALSKALLFDASSFRPKEPGAFSYCNKTISWNQVLGCGRQTIHSSFSSGSVPPGASTVSSVLVQRHSGADALQSKPIRNSQPPQNASKTTKSKPGSSTVRINHAPPVKVVH